MDKKFNSFHQMLEGFGQRNFRSFKDWAQTMQTPQMPQENREEESLPVNEEVHEPEPEIESEPTFDEDVVNSLMEKLSDFEWEEDLDEIEEIEEEILPKEPVKSMRPAEPLRTEPIRVKNEQTFSEKPKEKVEERVKHYKVFKDKEENFECNLKVEGTSLSDAKVRIVLESESWNFVFHGEIYGDGRCVVPIKKGIPLIEGATGNIKLEIIAEDQLFVGWEDTFKVETSKKIKVEVKDKKSIQVDFNNRFDRNH